MICSDVSTKITNFFLNVSVNFDFDNKSEQVNRYELCFLSDNFFERRNYLYFISLIPFFVNSRALR